MCEGRVATGRREETFDVRDLHPAALKAGGTGGTTKIPTAGSKKGQVGFTVSWAGGKGKTVAAVAFALQTSPGTCKAGTTRVSIKGTVKSGTGAAAKIIKTGEPVSASTCVITTGAKAGQSSLEPGTKFKL